MLSVIIPVYNAEKYIKETLSSILNSTFKDFEIIAVDDGSTDSSAELLDDVSEQDRRIKVHHQCNKGVSNARNTGLDLAQGEYITFVDADDVIEADYLQSAMQSIIARNADICCTSIKMFDEVRGGYLPLSYKHEKELYEGKELDQICAKYVFWRGLGCVWGKIYRRDSIGDIRFAEDIYRMEDVIFALDVFERANTCLFCDDAGAYIYRLHGDSVCNRFDANFGIQVDRILVRLEQRIESWNKADIFRGAMDETRVYLLHEWLLLSVVPDKAMGVSDKIAKTKVQLDRLRKTSTGAQSFKEKKWKIFDLICRYGNAVLAYMFVYAVVKKRNR